MTAPAPDTTAAPDEGSHYVGDGCQPPHLMPGQVPLPGMTTEPDTTPPDPPAPGDGEPGVPEGEPGDDDAGQATSREEDEAAGGDDTDPGTPRGEPEGDDPAVPF